MKKTLLTTCAFVMIALLPQSAFAWGFAGHKLIMRRAIELLPPELKPFFDQFKDEIVVRVTDPDTWRNVGWADDQNHFVDFGVREYGRYPFTALPRDYGTALEKFGRVALERNGLLPWREAEEFGNLRRAFEELKQNAPYTLSNLSLFSAVASHYIQDATQPFHATDNFDGAQTGNAGIHARFERDLIERFESRLKLTPAPPRPVTNARDTAFDELLASFQQIDPILKADREAIAGKDGYGDEYFEQFFTKVQPILEQRLSEGISATAGVIIGAWEQAGRPVVRAREARPVQKVRPAR
jgi:hypothetical protein